MSLDRSGYSSPAIPNKNFRENLTDFLDFFDLQDIWRFQNPTTRDFSWSRGEKLARLDYIFAPSSFPGQIRASHPKPCSYSDHNIVALTIRPCIQPRGKGFWKLKVSLLNREDFCEEINNVIETSINDSLDIAPDFRWEYIKLKVREASIKFTRKIGEETSRLESELEARLRTLRKDLDQSNEPREEFHGIKRELFQIQLIRARESTVRARTKWVGEGERPSKYYLNLEKKHFTAKTMTSVLNREGKMLTDPEEILAFEKDHFTLQYVASQANCTAQEKGEDEPFLQPSAMTVSESDRDILNREISVEELEWALRAMKNGKAIRHQVATATTLTSCSCPL